MLVTIRRMARESSITRARMSGPLQWAVGGAAADDDPLPGVVDAEGGLGGTEEQPPVGSHEVPHAAEDRLLGGQVEVDEHVAQVDHVERAHPRQRSSEVALAGVHHATEVARSEEHTSELQSRQYLVCRLLLEKK